MKAKLNKKTGKVEFNYDDVKEDRWLKVVRDINTSVSKSTRWLLIYHFVAFMLIMFLIIGATIYVYYKQGLINFEGRIDNDTISGFGTFLGGFVGTIFSGVAVFLVFLTYLSQKEELRLTRQEMKSQNETLIKQNYENTFFKLLEAYNQIANNVVYDSGLSPFMPAQVEVRFIGREAFKNANQDLRKSFDYTKNKKQDNSCIEIITDEIKVMLVRHSETFSHYFTTVHEILKFLRVLDKSNIPNFKFYRNFVTSQITTDELIIMFYYSLAKSDEYSDFLGLADLYKIFDRIFIIDSFISNEEKEIYKQLAPLSRLKL